MKLTAPQLRALSKLSKIKWLTAFDMKESIQTLDALVRKGAAIKRIPRRGLGSMFSPRTTIEYKKDVNVKI